MKFVGKLCIAESIVLLEYRYVGRPHPEGEAIPGHKRGNSSARGCCRTMFHVASSLCPMFDYTAAAREAEPAPPSVLIHSEAILFEGFRFILSVEFCSWHRRRNEDANNLQGGGNRVIRTAAFVIVQEAGLAE
jgi:hypothetical protein